MKQVKPSVQIQEEAVLKKAFFKATEILGLSRTQIEEMLGLSAASVSRLMTDSKKFISLDSKEGELALYFIRVFRSLDSLFGGNSEQEKLWLNSYNYHLNNKPVDLLKKIGGIVGLANYLDAMRGKV